MNPGRNYKYIANLVRCMSEIHLGFSDPRLKLAKIQLAVLWIKINKTRNKSTASTPLYKKAGSQSPFSKNNNGWKNSHLTKDIGGTEAIVCSC